jgi:hypothetical protein
MLRFCLVLVLSLLVADASMAETAATMPRVGFRYTVQGDENFTAASGASSKSHGVIHREVIASDGTTIQTRDEGTTQTPSGELSVSGKSTYRWFLRTDNESTTRRGASDQSPITDSQSWDCPADELDRFYSRGTAAQGTAAEVSLACKFTGKANGEAMGPIPVTVNFADLGAARDTVSAGTFDVRKIAVRYSMPETGFTEEITYDFAPTLGISVVQETKDSSRNGTTVRHFEVSDISPAQ